MCHPIINGRNAKVTLRAKVSPHAKVSLCTKVSLRAKLSTRAKVSPRAKVTLCFSDTYLNIRLLKFKKKNTKHCCTVNAVRKRG